MHLRTATLLILFVGIALAGAETRTRVSALEIEGNRLTGRWVIERELGIHLGDSLSASDLEVRRKRLNNLIIFNSVVADLDSVTGKTTVRVSEAWPLWPLLSVSLSEGQMSDILTKPRDFFRHATVDAGVSHLNIYGSGGGAYGAVQFGAAQGYSVGYNTRWLAPQWPVAVIAHFQNLREQSRHASVLDSTQYVRDIVYELDISRHKGTPTRPGIYTAYISLRGEQIRSADTRDSRTVWFSPYLILDHRDLEWFPSSGSYTEVRTDLVYGSPRFVRSSYDIRGYFPLRQAARPPSLALRFSAATATNSTPEWAHFYWGFYRTLRGYSDVKSESSNYLIGDIELRVPIGHESTYDVPLIGRWGKGWPWGLSALAYAQRGEFMLAGQHDSRMSYGAGLYLRVPWVQIIQTSVGFRRDGSRDFITGIGVSF